MENFIIQNYEKDKNWNKLDFKKIMSSVNATENHKTASLR